MAEGENYSTRGSYGLKLCHGSANALVDVVFVHGLTGNRETTWTHKKSHTFWPQDLLKDDLPDARILTFGYDADVLHFWSMASQNRIANHAQNLVNTLMQLRERSDTNERPLLFVAHSLGGLVVEDAILASKNSAEEHIQQLHKCTAGIAFLGTPHCGADMASWATVFGTVADMFKKTNVNILQTLKPDSEVLARVQNEFHTMIRIQRDSGQKQLQITCFYEELPVRAVGMIVPMHSAILPAYNTIGIRNNHMDMTKFSSREDPGYVAVSNELWRWVKQIKKRPQMFPGQGAANPSVGTAPPGSYPQTWWAPNPYQQQPGFPPNNLAQPGSGGPYSGYQSPNAWPGQPSSQRQQLPPPETQGGNFITGTTISGGGKAVQGNNIRSDKDVVFNF